MSRPGDRGWPTAVLPAGHAWRAGAFTTARDLAAALVAAGEGGDHARHLLVLARCALDDGTGAIAVYGGIRRSYSRLAELDEPVLWAHLHSGDLTGAMAFAQHRDLTRSPAVDAQLRLALDQPPLTSITGVADVPFTDDPLTPFMPGFDGAVNGLPAVLRLDTGGSYLHVSAEAAATYGIRVVTRERQFAALSHHWIGSGNADVDLGLVKLRNIPVAVHEKGMPATAIAAAFGVELGPIIGTDLLRPFLTTVDAPRARLLLSPRGDAEARAEHLAHVSTGGHRVPFGMVQGHRIIAAGSVAGTTEVPVFVDSGLVAATLEQGQVAMLAPLPILTRWGAAKPARGRFAELPGPLALGDARRDGLTALPVRRRTWRHLGHWDGVDVHALVSWGFLRHFSWTIDHDQQELLLVPGPA